MFSWFLGKSLGASAQPQRQISRYGRISVLLDQGTSRPSYFVRGSFGNYLLLSPLSEALAGQLSGLGGVKYTIPLWRDEETLRCCERLFKRYGAQVVTAAPLEVQAPMLSLEEIPQHAEQLKVQLAQGEGEETWTPHVELSIGKFKLHYPAAAPAEGSLALPRWWEADTGTLATFLSRQSKLAQVYHKLLKLLSRDRVLAFPAPEHLAVAIYDDFSYDRIDYDTLSPSARKTLSELLIAGGAEQKSALRFHLDDVELRFLKSPRSLSSPVLEGLTVGEDVIYLLTPTQLAAKLMSEPERSPESLRLLAKALPVNLEKLCASSKLPKFKRAERDTLREALAESGEYYRRRRQRGIRGRLASAEELREDDDEQEWEEPQA
ncbi:MAG: hypothetical protein VYD19_03475 [Myxococcota bacterium]|nr:hypothetical protein [Myxococcota bacterium]